MTETKPFTQLPKTYFGILLKTKFQKKGWLYTLLVAIGCIHLYWFFSNDSYGNLIWAILCFLIPLFVVVYLWRFSVSDENKEFLSEKQLFFDSEKIKIIDANQNEGIIPYQQIQFIKDSPNYWLLYIGKNQFFYIPKNIFNTPEDFDKFQQFIQQ